MKQAYATPLAEAVIVSLERVIAGSNDNALQNLMVNDLIDDEI